MPLNNKTVWTWKRNAEWFRTGFIYCYRYYYPVPKTIIALGFLYALVHCKFKSHKIDGVFMLKFTCTLHIVSQKDGLTWYSNHTLNLKQDFLKTENIMKAYPTAGYKIVKNVTIFKKIGCLFGYLPPECLCYVFLKWKFS